MDRLLDLRMHASILIQFTDQTDAYTLQVAPETGRVIGHRSATCKRITQVVPSNGAEYQGAVLYGFGHGRCGVHVPAHGCHAVATHACEGRSQPHGTTVGRWP